MAGIGSSERQDWPTAVVVGAGGLGTAVARRLGLSHRLLVADRDADHVERQCAALRGDGYDAVAVTCDVTRPADIAQLSALASTRPAVKALANVVGLSPAAQDFGAIMAVNLVGASCVADAFEDVLEPGGAAVFISSSAAHMQPVPENLLPILDDPLDSEFLATVAAILGANANANHAYSLSKAGLNRMCRRKSIDWGKRGLRIVSLSPGLIAPRRRILQALSRQVRTVRSDTSGTRMLNARNRGRGGFPHIRSSVIHNGHRHPCGWRTDRSRKARIIALILESWFISHHYPRWQVLQAATHVFNLFG
jgi:NAD(P)-dependent dehydrogenase (short-subunit alcohol dehydrogenase family)